MRSRLLLLLLFLPLLINAQQKYFSAYMQMDDSLVNLRIRQHVHNALEKGKLTVFKQQLRIMLSRSETQPVLDYMTTTGDFTPDTNPETMFNHKAPITYSRSNTYEYLFYWDSGKQQGALYGLAFPIEYPEGYGSGFHLPSMYEFYLGELATVLPKNEFDLLISEARKSIPAALTYNMMRNDITPQTMQKNGSCTLTVKNPFLNFDVALNEMESLRDLPSEGYEQLYGFGIDSIMEAAVRHMDDPNPELRGYVDAQLNSQLVGDGRISYVKLNSIPTKLQNVLLLDDWKLDDPTVPQVAAGGQPIYTLDYMPLKHSIKSLGLLYAGSTSNSFFWINYADFEKLMQKNYPAYLKAFELYSESNLLIGMR